MLFVLAKFSEHKSVHIPHNRPDCQALC